MHHKTFKSSIGFPDPGKDADTFIDLDRLWAAVVRRANVIAASVIAAVVLVSPLSGACNPRLHRDDSGASG